MALLDDIIAHAQTVERTSAVAARRRDDDGWRQAIDHARGRPLRRCSACGATHGDVHMALLDETSGDIAVVSYRLPGLAAIRQVGARHPPAIRLERAIRDLFGLEADRLAGHAALARSRLLGCAASARRPGSAAQKPAPYAFLPAEGEGLHQIPVGPVHAGIIEPGHFRFTANGETRGAAGAAARLCAQGHRVADGGRDARARRRSSPARTSGDSTVAYALAFAQAAEAALQIEAPPRALYLRALMAELERLANHFGDIGAICNDASFSLMHAQCGILRERTLARGGRLLRPPADDGPRRAGRRRARPRAGRRRAGCARLLDEIAAAFPAAVELYDNTASLQDRTVTTGIRQAGLRAPVRRRRLCRPRLGPRLRCAPRPGYPPYDELAFEVPVLDAGDVNARVWIRIREVEQSLSLIEQILDSVCRTGRSRPSRPAAARLAKAWRWSKASAATCWSGCGSTATARVARCHLRDPSWFQWPLLEAAIEGNIVADFPLCNKSFNCSYSGHDL